MKNELNKIGIEAKLQGMEDGAYYARVFAHDFSGASQGTGFRYRRP